MPPYIVEIMKRSIERGRVSDAGLAGARWLSSKCFHRIQVVYANNTADTQPPGTRISVDTTDHEAILAWAREYHDMNFDVRASAAKGGVFWMILEASTPIGFVITRPATVMTTYYFPFPERGAHVSYSYLKPESRGGGRFGEARARLLEQLHRRGVEWLVTNCDWWNLPARRGVEHTGAREIGRGWKRRDSSRCFKPLGPFPWQPGADSDPEMRPQPVNVTVSNNHATRGRHA